MKVKEAIELLSHCDPENELVMEDDSVVSFGSKPCFKLSDKSFYDGFDWDTGKTFIRIERNKYNERF